MKLSPAKITLGQVMARLSDIRQYLAERDTEAVENEQYQLFVDVLHTIAHAPTMADKRELKRLAAAALEANEMVNP